MGWLSKEQKVVDSKAPKK
jgi:hypothetical protein